MQVKVVPSRLPLDLAVEEVGGLDPLKIPRLYYFCRGLCTM